MAPFYVWSFLPVRARVVFRPAAKHPPYKSNRFRAWGLLTSGCDASSGTLFLVLASATEDAPMISALDQLSFDQAFAAQQAGQQNSGSSGDPAQFAAQFAQMLAASQGQGQNTGQQATPASLTYSANTLATQVSQASQASQTSQVAADPNTVIAAQIQSNLTAQVAATSATQTPEQAKSQQDSLVLQSLNYQASLAMNQGNIPAFMTFQALINKQMTSMGLIAEKAKVATTAAATPNQTAHNSTTTKKSTTKNSAKVATAVAAAAAGASQVAASNASTGSSASAQLTDTVLSNAGTTGSSAAELASNASTTGSQSAALASNAGAGGATAAQNQPDATDPTVDLDALQAELEALLADLEGESLDAALDALASVTSKYGSAQAA